ncbi:MAG: hypothetical protein U1A78_29680 [Polyangia bacterium]
MAHEASLNGPVPSLGHDKPADRAATPAPRWSQLQRLGVLTARLLACCAALAVDAFGLAATLTGRLHALSGTLILLVHIAACAVAALSLRGMLPMAQASARRAELLFLFGLTFFLPALGTLGLLVAIIVERTHDHEPPRPKRSINVQIPELPHQPLLVADRPQYGDGALSALLRYSPNPDRRLSAVLAARRLRDANDVAVLRLALTDPVDDVRLLAYSILDRKEQAFNARLKALGAQLEAPHLEPRSRARLRKRRAQTLFEMIHLELAQGEVKSYLLSEARQDIDAALQDMPEDREAHFLLGTIALSQSDLPTAEKALLRAQVQGMAIEKVLPYLAEAAFLGRRFSMVVHYLRAVSPLYFRTQPRLGGIAAFWLPEERR